MGFFLYLCFPIFFFFWFNPFFTQHSEGTFQMSFSCLKSNAHLIRSIFLTLTYKVTWVFFPNTDHKELFPALEPFQCYSFCLEFILLISMLLASSHPLVLHLCVTSSIVLFWLYYQNMIISRFSMLWLILFFYIYFDSFYLSHNLLFTMLHSNSALESCHMNCIGGLPALWIQVGFSQWGEI